MISLCFTGPFCSSNFEFLEISIVVQTEEITWSHFLHWLEYDMDVLPIIRFDLKASRIVRCRAVTRAISIPSLSSADLRICTCTKKRASSILHWLSTLRQKPENWFCSSMWFLLFWHWTHRSMIPWKVLGVSLCLNNAFPCYISQANISASLLS